MNAIEHTAKLTVSPEEALKYLQRVDHQTFSEARDKYWVVDDQRNVKAQSALWLFCWAKTGQNSEAVAEYVRRIFNGIMNIGFDDFEKKIPHEWARKMRDHEGDIEAEFAAYFS